MHFAHFAGHGSAGIVLVAIIIVFALLLTSSKEN